MHESNAPGRERPPDLPQDAEESPRLGGVEPGRDVLVSPRDPGVDQLDLEGVWEAAVAQRLGPRLDPAGRRRQRRHQQHANGGVTHDSDRGWGLFLKGAAQPD